MGENKPFLLSKVRCQILNYSMNIQDIIVHSYTDSIVTTKEISEFPISDKKAISKLNMDLFI